MKKITKCYRNRSVGLSKKRIHNISEFNIYFSEDAVIGLGTELVHLYMEKVKMPEIYLPNANDDYIAEGLGICISPNSTDITFLVKNMNIDELLHNKKCNEFEAKENFKSNIFIEDYRNDRHLEYWVGGLVKVALFLN